MTTCNKYLLQQTAPLSLVLLVSYFRVIIHSKPQGNIRLLVHIANLCTCVHECLRTCVSIRKAYGLYNGNGEIIYLSQNIKNELN
jgi:hypothetical protein